MSLVGIRAGNRVGRAGLGQNRAGPKLTWFFRAKNLTAQPALKTELGGPNSLLKAKKIRAGRAGSGYTRPDHIGSGQIWPGFFRANNLMVKPGLNSRLNGASSSGQSNFATSSWDGAVPSQTSPVVIALIIIRQW